MVQGHRHVHSFLAPVDPLGTIVAFGRSLFEAAEHDRPTAEVVRRVMDWVQQQREALRGRLPQAAGVTASEDTPELEILGIAYLHTREVLRRVRFSISPALERLSKSGVADLEQFMGTVEQDFLYELLSESERRAKFDPALRIRLEQGKEDVRRMLRQFNQLSRTSPLLAEYQKKPGSKDPGTMYATGAIFAGIGEDMINVAVGTALFFIIVKSIRAVRDK